MSMFESLFLSLITIWDARVSFRVLWIRAGLGLILSGDVLARLISNFWSCRGPFLSGFLISEAFRGVQLLFSVAAPLQSVEVSTKFFEQKCVLFLIEYVSFFFLFFFREWTQTCFMFYSRMIWFIWAQCLRVLIIQSNCCTNEFSWWIYQRLRFISLRFNEGERKEEITKKYIGQKKFDEVTWQKRLGFYVSMKFIIIMTLLLCIIYA